MVFTEKGMANFNVGPTSLTVCYFQLFASITLFLLHNTF